MVPVLAGSVIAGARADEPIQDTAATERTTIERHPIQPRKTPSPRLKGETGGSSGWWLGTAGIALALALFGGISLASRRYLPQAGTGQLRVIGRTSLSPRHSVYLIQVSDRVLIVGAGPQASPNLLGELTDPDEIARITPARPTVALRPLRTAASDPTVGFDRRVGDDE
jgi:flagellar biogenesis protein FliO